VERRSRWKFENETAGWVWKVSHPDGTTEASQLAFKTLKECADDAARHGYVAWKPEKERRQDLVLGVAKAIRHESSR
jgi:hypothetical protein